MSNEYRPLSEATKKKVLNGISRLDMNSDVAEQVISFLKQELDTKNYVFYLSNDSSKQGYFYINECLEFGKSIEKHVNSFKDLNWNTFCLQVHGITYSKKLSKVSVVELLSKFYIFIKDTTERKMVRENIEVCEHLLISAEQKVSLKKIRDNNEEAKGLYDNCIMTNFPIGSCVDHIYKIRESNLYLKTNSSVIKELLIEFLYTIVKPNKIYYRILLYFFEDSLENCYSIDSIYSFNFETYKKQYWYFKGIDEQYALSLNQRTSHILNEFYRFLDNKLLKDEGKHLFNSYKFHVKQLGNSHFVKFIEEGYDFYIRSAHETVPFSDKWVLCPKRSNSADMASLSSYGINFTNVNNTDDRILLKDYIWIMNSTNSNAFNACSTITNFLNELELFHLKLDDKIIYLDGSKRKKLPLEFILSYRAKLEEEYTERVVDNKLGWIKNYLKTYKHIYGIDEIMLLNFEGLGYKETGGNPITKEDFPFIHQEFKNQINDHKDGELFYIIFRLSCTTKLRLGEIINLERDCVISCNERYGEVKYVSKTSNETVKDIFLCEEISLINRANEITSSYVNLSKIDDSKYIFLVTFRKYIALRVGGQYTRYFGKLIKKLFSEGKISQKYKPYNGRHTFIDSAWQAVEDNKITTLEVSTITGNSAGVAVKHYRKYDTVRFIEATYMVHIGDVKINGEIVEDENEIDTLQQVEQGAGACNSGSCVKKDELEDSAFKCLTCGKFVTSVGRLYIFENRLEQYTLRKNEASNMEERNWYEKLSELYAAYIAEIYTKSGVDN
ncbi:hypothetical protein [Paenibacillus alginolyticus]|uniref:Tyr recombinase domain-containing protein n=1 Tax=Paenibacillus alginolyticus TaxID=59839 RepID=A0ABT4G7P9_9BACL|nr:hypothetical protein [Paenibacillus alginolyticus]MCY9692205.1 hypothetical protein [Paenibacillus alginolyticus]MEC0145956.1 hypothetical protein [Paenibacillus alginolyticus]